MAALLSSPAGTGVGWSVGTAGGSALPYPYGQRAGSSAGGVELSSDMVPNRDKWVGLVLVGAGGGVFVLLLALLLASEEHVEGTRQQRHQVSVAKLDVRHGCSTTVVESCRWKPSAQQAGVRSKPSGDLMAAAVASSSKALPDVVRSCCKRLDASLVSVALGVLR